MTLHKDVIAEIEASESGPHIGAFFDFDGTIIYGYSAFTFIREQVKRGDVSAREFAELAAAMTSFGLGSIGFSSMMVITSQFMRGMSEASYIEFAEQLHEKYISRLIYPESRALIEAHERKGHTVAIISSALPYQVEPAAKNLGIEHVLCSRLEVKNGKFTGSVERPTCFGPGKVTAAKELATRFGVDLQDTFFYSDSDDDLELLKAVGKPRPLNPNRKLTAIAERHGWPIRRFASRGRAGITDWARAIAATGSVVGSFAAGLPIWALTGSRRRAQNFSATLFAETASALIGLNLKVEGEENLWSHRPAVFVFNHQSKADVVIMVSLLRRDIAGVGKQEIRKIPVVGKVMELAGTVLIDRANAGSAIEAMKPLVDVMQKEGKSVVIAPEGTRTITPKLAPFKKGAFHLAIQAGVPIVPVVIHNALDSAPKGDFVFHPATVEVDVLPPVDTSNWKAETIDTHIHEVRCMFQRTLGQPEDPPGARTVAGKSSLAKPASKSKTSLSKTGSKVRRGNASASVSGNSKSRARSLAVKKPAATSTIQNISLKAKLDKLTDAKHAPDKRSGGKPSGAAASSSAGEPTSVEAGQPGTSNSSGQSNA
ncbi:MAG: HAD-IB family hydrolase [Gammaproteobacteria bacterium]|nr:HAD-IB family hydrolase [Gammaproteobacteria bacterium]MBT8152199.1 HAD-IB family hydrolase [Gammaproteobacteria bacterium]NNL11454.1 HAD-IB family hydrolase [Pseudomonadales bacterium]NNM10785.1 HAD-IB family hydrolase [Pseudomonadales bacterium]RZV56123.1 MAG: HAD-IB family hydrolase [Pseudomonadales bacterium]